jgi:hypothetical protein
MELSDATDKTPATPGIDPRTFRLVAQRLNHYATPGILGLMQNGNLFQIFSFIFVFFSTSFFNIGTFIPENRNIYGTLNVFRKA